MILAIHGVETPWGQFASEAAIGVAPDWPAYRALVLPHLLYELATASDFEERADVRRRVSEALRRAQENKLVEEALIEASRGPEAFGQAILQQFHSDHQQLYQSEPRAHVRILRLPLLDAPTQLARLTTLQRRLVAGEVDLESAAAQIGGEVTDLGWQGASLEDLDPKARTYVLEVAGTGFSVPYRLDEWLAMVEVVEREAPRPLAFDEVVDQVRDDYFGRHQQELYRAAIDRTLEAAGFEYFEDRVRAVLSPD